MLKRSSTDGVEKTILAACEVRGHRATNVFEQVPVVNSQQPDCEHASMSHMRFVALSILFFITAAHSTAVGQTIPSAYTFIEFSQEWSVFAGKSDINPGRLGLGPRNATVFGGRYAVAFGGAMSVDMSGTLFKSTRDVLDVSKPADDRVLGRSDIDVVLFDIRLRLNLTGQRAWHGFQPFIAFGAGVAYAASTDRIIEGVSVLPADEWYSLGTRFAGTFGGGANFHVSSKLSVRLEGVVNLWKVKTPAGWLTVDADPDAENPEDEWVSAKSITLGASWRR